MIHILISLLFLNPITPEGMLKQMHNTYKGKWYKTFSFTQHNEFYKADTVSKTSIWHEAISFPDKFRIDIGDIDDGNAAILANDSIYRFKKGKLIKKDFRKNNLTFLGGGMFFMEWSEVLREFEELNYDLSKGYQTDLDGRETFVIGAEKGDLESNQIWVDLEHLYVVRVISTDKSGTKMDGRYSGFERVGDGWTETVVTFYIDDKLYQKEVYTNYKANGNLSDKLFDPAYFGQIHWIK